MDDDLKPRSVKIGSARWARWQDEARARGLSLTALIVERMDQVPAMIAANAQARAVVTSLESRIIDMEAHIQGMAETLDARNTTIATLESGMLALRDELTEARKALAPAQSRPEVVASPVAGSGRSHPRLAALRSDPANRIIDPKVSHPSGPVLKSAVPAVVGDVGWSNLKAKGKPKE